MIEHGKCLNCGKDIIVKKVVDMKIIDTLTSQYSEEVVELSDGSKMRVSVCKDCREKGSIDIDKIMDKVKNTWIKAISHLKTTEKSRKRMKDRYMKLKVKNRDKYKSKPKKEKK